MLSRRTHFFQRTREPLAVLDAEQRLIDANEAFYRALNRTSEQVTQLPLLDLLLESDRTTAEQALGHLSRSGHVGFRARSRHAPQRWLQWLVSADYDAEIAYVVAHDVTQQRHTDLRISMLHIALEHAAEAVLILDVIGTPDELLIGYANIAMSVLSGYDREQLIGAPIDMLCQLPPESSMPGGLSGVQDGEISISELAFYRRDGSTYQAECRMTPLRDSDGRLTHVVMLQQDLTARRQRDAVLEYQAHYDLVTGLLNRFSLTDLLDERIANDGDRQPFAVCILDLDRFNRINDTLGHTLGDDLLSDVGHRLRDSLPPHIILARMGGDEFALVAPAADDGEALQIALDLLHTLDQPFIAGEHTLYLSAGVGVSLYPRDGQDSGTLLKHADSAMYLAKAQGRNHVRIFTPELARAAQERLDLDNQLRRAIEAEEFVLHYQPQLDLRSGKVIGVESLIRWQHPDRGLLAPGAFIAAAEESHLMPRLARWVIHESCHQAMQWQRAGHPPIRMAVNVSAPQFEVDDIVSQVAEALNASGLAPRWFDLEITESMLMRNPEDSAAKIMQLRALGVRVTIDDFGTGYSSLAYLQQFPVDALKIDRSFVRDIDDHENGLALIQAIVGLAHSLGLQVVAEGVEEVSQHRRLQTIGCDEVQGYLFAYPLPAAQVWEAIARLNRD